MRLEPATCAEWHAENLARVEALGAHAGWVVAATAPLGDGAALSVERLSTGHPRGDYVRGAVTLAAALDVAADRLLVDPDAHVAWDPTVARARMHDQLEADGVGHRLRQIAVLTGAHPLVRNRDLVYHEAVVREPGAVTTVAASRPAPHLAPFPGHRRAWLGLSHRRVEALGGGRLRYTALWQTDLGGWLPRVAVTSGQVKAMLAEHRTFHGWWPA